MTMGSGKKKIEIKKIEKESARMVTFSKRRKGLFKKAQEFRSKTGANVAIIVFSPAGNPYTFGDISTVTGALSTFLGADIGSSTCTFGGNEGFKFDEGPSSACAS